MVCRSGVAGLLLIGGLLCLPGYAAGAQQGLEAAPGGAQVQEPEAEAEAPEVVGPYAPDQAEEGSVEAIAEYTTAPEFLPHGVSYVPDSDLVPSPVEILGRQVGTPDELSTVAQIHDYFRGLAAASDRVEVEVLGTSEEGREILLARISEPANLERVERLSEVTAALADPRLTPREEVGGLVAEGLPFYYLMGGLHSPETGSPEMLMELAYRLAVSQRPEVELIRQRLVVLITPVVEVDGRDRQVEWYYRHLRGRELSFEALREFSSPPYWGHYAYHDNNRDGMQHALALTRAVNDAYWRYHPQVVHDLHESVPLVYLSTGHGPYSLAIDPVTINEWTQFSHHEAAALQAQGLPGVWTWGFWDGWWPGYLFSVANNHHSVGRFYETFGNSLAGTFERDLENSRYVGKPVTERQWYRPWPPDEKLTWSLRNNTNYMQAAVLEALEYAARHGEELLQHFWVKGDRAWRRGSEEPPFAWVFRLAQRDSRRLDYLVNRLLAHRIEVHSLSEPLTLGDATYGIGTYVVRMDQPYGPAAVNFLSEQRFPADEPNPPYDDVAWTWPLLYGVEGEEIDDSAILDAAMQPVAGEVRTPGLVEGFGEYFLLRDTGQNGMLGAAVMLAGHRLEAAESSFRAGGIEYPAGSWIVQAPLGVVEGAASRWGLLFNGIDALPDPPTHPLDLPRLAVLHLWSSTQDAGWVRYTLDQDEIPYSLISPDDVKRGGLARRFDVIVFANSRGNLTRLIHGIDPRYGPLPYTQTAEFPSHGRPNSSPDITGGMGFAGLLNLQDFVEQGGVLVALGNSGRLPVEGGLVRRVRLVPRAELNSPGSELQARVLQPDHPITYGYPEISSIFRGNQPLFDVAKRDRSWGVLQFGTGEPPAQEPVGEAEEAAGDEGAAAPAPAGQEEIAAGEGVELADLVPEGEIQEEELGEETEVELPPEEEPEREIREGLVLSGYVRGEKTIAGKPAILDVPVGSGRVVLFAFNPLHRYLNHSDFRWLYNVILNWNDLPER